MDQTLSYYKLLLFQEIFHTFMLSNFKFLLFNLRETYFVTIFAIFIFTTNLEQQLLLMNKITEQVNINTYYL